MSDSEVKEVPQEQSTQADIPSGDERNGMTSGVDTETEKEVPSKESSKKETILPKRPAVTAKRSGTGPSSSAAKSITSTTSRTMDGLSKPPTRPSSNSVGRKTTSNAASSASANAGHRASPSVSSADERKPSTSTSRRTSVAPHVSNSSSKTATTAATARKPATSTASSTTTARTSVSSSAPKPTGANGVPAARPGAPATKPAAGGVVSDTKRRLSTMAGSLGTTSKSTTRPVAGSSSTKDIEELKAKLQVSETRVQELQAEIEVSQKKLLAMGQKLDDESIAVTEAQKQIRTQHDDMVEKLRADHKSDVEALQSQLDGAKADVESARLALDSKDSDATAATEMQLAEHATALADSKAKLDSAKEDLTLEIAKKEAEVAELSSKLEISQAGASSTKEALETLQAEYDAKNEKFDAELTSRDAIHAGELEDLKKLIAEEHEAALTSLKSSHEAALERGLSDTTSSNEVQLKELTDKHETEKANLLKQVEEAIESHAALTAAHKDSSESVSKEHAASLATLETELKELRLSSEEDKQALAAATAELSSMASKLDGVQKELAASTEKCNAFQTDSVKAKESLTAATEELSEVKKEVLSLQKMMDAVDEEGKGKDEVHNKVKEDLAVALRSLEDTKKDMSLVHEKHRKELETVSADYEKEIAALEGNTGFKDKYEELTAKHEDLVKSHAAATQIVDSHAQTIEQLKQDHALAFESLSTRELAHEQALEALKSIHAKDLDEAHDKAVVAGDATHAAELKELQDSHSKAISALEEQHMAAQAQFATELEQHKATEAEFQNEIVKSTSSISEAQVELDAVKSDLALEKSAKVTAQAELDAALNKKPDTSEADSLRTELQALREQHESALATAHEESTKATEKHETAKEALQKAQADLEVALNKKPDTSEADSIREELLALKENHETALANAQQESTKATEQYLATKEYLAKAQADLDAALNKQPDTSEADSLREELQALKGQYESAIADAQQESTKTTEQYLAAKEDLAKMQTDLDAALNRKPDTSEADSLREELQALKEQNESAIAEAQQELTKANEQHLAAKEELAMMQTDLDAALNKQPDTSEADGLRQDLQALKDQHQAALMTAQQESAKATEEHLAAKEALEKLQTDGIAEKEAAEAKHNTSKADYKDMHDSMTQLVEEANKKVADNAALIAELEANLKVKDAELAEAKTKAANIEAPVTLVKPMGGLSSSRFSTETGDAPVETAPEVGGEQDNSSAALASLAAAKVTVSQLEDMNADLKSENLRMLKSISDVTATEPISP